MIPKVIDEWEERWKRNLSVEASCIVCRTEYEGNPFKKEDKISCPICKERKQKEYEEQYLKDHIQEYMEKAGVPKRLLDSQDTRNITGFITGPAGVGKSWIAAAMVRKALLAHQKVRFIPITKLLRTIRDSFSDKGNINWQDEDNLGSTDSEIIEKLLRFDLLVLDDLGAEKTTDFAKQAIYEIIDGRYQAMKDTIITSNLSLQDISARFDDRIASRIAGMGKILKLTGKDRRLS